MAHRGRVLLGEADHAHGRQAHASRTGCFVDGGTFPDTNYGFIRHPILQAALDNGSFRMDPSLNSPELLAQISPVLRRQPESSVALGDVRLSGSLFDLPGGAFGLAVGETTRIGA